ncbi:putative bifunctional diguanylate cyclase/phosphodiesterase [Sphingosinithalassobacter sp. CS137]|uniref:putative bifunctional diguanylate cyclase/phosphodiesterase n=1 Tax=Sphingosinithalassobacter sp. CS137 TaxID=2762748 RepID=UPI00165D8192|nr:EAL domain-containing protein [Sphingosinithalassobacter sp. CS137]
MKLRPIKWFMEVGQDPILAQAQAVQMRRQVPLLYGLLLINSTALAWSHADNAPILLTVAVPAFLLGVTAVRLIHWVRIRNDPTPEPQEARRQLRVISLAAAGFGVGYLAWSLSLAQYGGPFEQAHTALYVSTTVIGCIFCLIHVPQAAILGAAGVLPAYFLALLGQDQHAVFAPIALNVLLVVLVLLRVLCNTFENFSTEVAAREKLAEQHEEMVRLNAENHALAHTDSLTQLGNRRRFLADITAVTGDPANVGVTTIGVIDLDRFKPVNDTFGHSIGDELLNRIAERLRQVAGPSATLYRLGGDEFGVILHASPEEAAEIAERLCQAVAMPIFVGNRELSVGASPGLAHFMDEGTACRALWEHADHALYHAKRHRRGTAVTFTDDLEDVVRGEQLLEVELKAIDVDKDLQVHVQPIVDYASGGIVGGEVLVRWTSPQLGSVSPERFIAIAERSTIIHRITLSVVERALQLLAQLPEHYSLSVNVSACDLNAPETISAILSAVRRSRSDPGRLWIEVTETAVMRDLDAAIEALNMLRGAGLKIALDDFGTGYSSLSNLHRLPLDRVKIDRSFANDLGNSYSSSISRAVIGLCETLELSCVAEGVETAEQAALLREMGCTLLQGYFIAKPLPIAQFLALDAAAEHTAEYKAA